MTRNYIKAESPVEDLHADPDHDALYSDPEQQRAHLEAKGYSDEEIEEILSEGSEEAVEEGNSKNKSHNPPGDYETCDDALKAAHESLVQWNADKRLSEFDISKAPGVWESQDQVPDWVLETLKEMIRSGDAIWHGGYEKLPPSAEAEIQKVLEDKLTQPQGWSLDSLLRDLKDHYPDVEDDYLLTILRNETSAVLNTARERAYEEREDAEEYVFDWIGPNDWRTTDTCLAIEEEIEDRGGAVPMEELREILYQKALEHSDDEGTPNRVDDWMPHHQCRRTFTRRVQSI